MNQRRTAGARSMNKVVKRLRGKLSLEACVASGRIRSAGAFHSESSPASARRPARRAAQIRRPARSARAQLDRRPAMRPRRWARRRGQRRPSASSQRQRSQCRRVLPRRPQMAGERPVLMARLRRLAGLDDEDFMRASSRLMSGVQPELGVQPGTPPRESSLSAKGKRRRLSGFRDINGCPTFGSMRSAWAVLGCDYVGGLPR